MPRKGALMLSSDGASTNFAKKLGRLREVPIGIFAVIARIWLFDYIFLSMYVISLLVGGIDGNDNNS